MTCSSDSAASCVACKPSRSQRPAPHSRRIDAAAVVDDFDDEAVAGP